MPSSSTSVAHAGLMVRSMPESKNLIFCGAEGYVSIENGESPWAEGRKERRGEREHTEVLVQHIVLSNEFFI